MQKMQIQPIKSFQQQNQSSSQASLKSKNLAILKAFVKSCPISIITFMVMVLMFIISTILTYQESSHEYSIKNLSPKVLISLGANYGLSAKYGQIYRLIMPIFLHAGFMHFLMNSFSMVGLLMNVEGLFRWKNFLAAFFVGGIHGNIMSCYAAFLKGATNIVAVGASTSICAVLGLYLATLYIVSLKQGNVESTKKKILFMIGYLFVISIIPGVDFYGHFGSFISGALIGLSFSGLKSDYSEDSLAIKKLKLLALILFANYSLLLLSLFFI